MHEDLQSDYDQMLKVVELDEIRCFEIHARLLEDEHDERAPESSRDAELSIRVKADDETLSVRVKADLSSLEVEAWVDMAAIFTKPKDSRYPRPVMDRFIKEVGLFTVLPFVREAAADVTRRVGGEAHMLALQAPNEFELSKRQESEGT